VREALFAFFRRFLLGRPLLGMLFDPRHSDTIGMKIGMNNGVNANKHEWKGLDCHENHIEPV
jgi:hypothetical protein